MFTENEVILELKNVSKTFPGVKALDAVNFKLRAGEIHALIGENGAGKSTLVKVVTGVYHHEEGEIRLMERTIVPDSPGHAQELGISTVYQEVNLLPNLSVAHNLFLGRQLKKRGLIDWKRINRESEEILKRYNLEIDVTRDLSEYSVAIQQLIAVARGVSMSAKVLILDEPTASLDLSEVQTLFATMRQLKNEGIGIIFITHFLDQVYEISDRITILRNGGFVGEFKTKSLPKVELIANMLGKELKIEEQSIRKRTEISEETDALLELKKVGRRDTVQDIDLEVIKGEVLGITGLLGSGRTEVCRLVFGVDKKENGTMYYDYHEINPKKPKDSMKLGIGLCPEDRKMEGIIGPLSVRQNIVLALQVKTGIWNFISKKKAQVIADKYIKEMQISTPDADKPLQELSGGNQQKVILARWLAVQPELLVLDEPTRGIDVGAHAEIIHLIKKLCDEGLALLVTSSELEELVSFADRVAVMRDRKKIAELVGENISQQNIMNSIAQSH